MLMESQFVCSCSCRLVLCSICTFLPLSTIQDILLRWAPSIHFQSIDLLFWCKLHLEHKLGRSSHTSPFCYKLLSSCSRKVFCQLLLSNKVLSVLHILGSCILGSICTLMFCHRGSLNQTILVEHFPNGKTH